MTPDDALAAGDEQRVGLMVGDLLDCFDLDAHGGGLYLMVDRRDGVGGVVVTPLAHHWREGEAGFPVATVALPPSGPALRV